MCQINFVLMHVFNYFFMDSHIYCSKFSFEYTNILTYLFRFIRMHGPIFRWSTMGWRRSWWKRLEKLGEASSICLLRPKKFTQTPQVPMKDTEADWVWKKELFLIGMIITFSIICLLSWRTSTSGLLYLPALGITF